MASMSLKILGSPRLLVTSHVCVCVCGAWRFSWDSSIEVVESLWQVQIGDNPCELDSLKGLSKSELGIFPSNLQHEAVVTLIMVLFWRAILDKCSIQHFFLWFVYMRGEDQGEYQSKAEFIHSLMQKKGFVYSDVWTSEKRRFSR